MISNNGTNIFPHVKNSILSFGPKSAFLSIRKFFVFMISVKHDVRKIRYINKQKSILIYVILFRIRC
jgi:hypothetical protein